MATDLSVHAVIPTRARTAAWLVQSIASALAAKEVRAVWVIDDDAPRPVAELVPSDPRVQVVRMASRGGPAAARNRGLDRVAADPGAWALLLDDDDALLPGALGHALASWMRTRPMAIVSARIETLADGRRPIMRPAPKEWAGRVLPNAACVFRPIALFGASGCVLSPAAIATGERFDPALEIGEDRDLLRRLGRHGPIAVNAEPMISVRLHPASDRESLSRAAHMARRIQDHLVLIERHLEPESEAYLRDATRWLLNAAARSRVPERCWSELSRAARARGWPVPIKARWRRVVRRSRRSSAAGRP